MAWGDEDDQQDYFGGIRNDVTNALVYGNKGTGAEAQSAPTPQALPGPQPAQGNYSTKETTPAAVPGSTTTPDAPTVSSPPHPMQSQDDDYLKPIPYNSPQRPASLDQAQKNVDADRQQTTQYGTALNREDYKPGIGRRIAGSIFAGMEAFGHNPNALRDGEDAIWAKYNNAEAARQTNFDSANKRLQQDQDNYNTQSRDYRNSVEDYERGYNYQNLAQERAARANDHRAQEQQRLQGIAPGSEAPDDPQNPMGGWHATSVGGQRVNMQQPPDNWLKTPQGVAAQRDADVQRMQLTGDDAKFYRANGKLKEPAAQTNIRMPSAESEMFHDWSAAFKRDNGHAPTAADIERFKRGNGRGSSSSAPGKMSDASARIIIQKKNDDMGKAQRRYQTAISTAMSDGDRQAAEDDYLDDAETAQRAYEEQIKQRTGEDLDPFDIRGQLKASLHGGGGAQSQPQAPAQTAPAPPAQSKPSAAPQAQQAPTQGKPQSPAAPQQPAPSAGQRETPPKATTPPPKGAQGRVKGSDGNWYWFAGNKVLGRSN